MKKQTKKFLKGLQKQTEAATAGTRYSTDFMTGNITKVEPKKKDKGKITDAQQEREQETDGQTER